jgi:hypothetical protein
LGCIRSVEIKKGGVGKEEEEEEEEEKDDSGRY